MPKRLVIVVAAFLLWAAPAQAFSKQSGTRTMDDGAALAYDLYLPDGTAPVTGWPGVVVMHGLGGSKDSVADTAAAFANDGWAVLAYSSRGQGTSTGDLTLAGPRETEDQRAMEQFFAGLPQVSDTEIGAWGVSYGGGQIWNGLAAGIPYKAADLMATWTDLWSALWPQGIARSGIVAGFAHSVEATSPFIKSVETVAVDSSNPAAVKALADQRSVNAALGQITTPVYLFQGRVDWAFDVTQAENAYLKVKGPKHLYIGQFGHPPSTFMTADVPYAVAQGIAWLDHYVRGQANGIDRTPPVAVAAATGAKRTTYPGIPKTKLVGMGFRGTTANRLGPRIGEGLETFGVSLVKVQVQRVSNYPRLVAVLHAGNRVISHGAIKPTKGLDTIRLANYVQYLPKGTRLTLSLGPDGGAVDFAYLGFPGASGSITLGSAYLTLQTLTKPISGP